MNQNASIRGKYTLATQLQVGVHPGCLIMNVEVELGVLKPGFLS